MHTAIIYAVLPESPRQADRERAALLFSETEKLEQAGSALRLGDFVWQIDFRASPDALARIVVACERLAISYRILSLDAEPQWIRRDPSL
jgi:hypothetical protein